MTYDSFSETVLEACHFISHVRTVYIGEIDVSSSVPCSLVLISAPIG